MTFDTILLSVKDYGATGALVVLVLVLVLILREITALTIGIQDLANKLTQKVQSEGGDRRDEHDQMMAMLSQQNMVLSLLIGDPNFKAQMAAAAKELGLKRRKGD